MTLGLWLSSMDRPWRDGLGGEELGAWPCHAMGHLGVEDDLGNLAILHRRAIVVPSRIAKGEACLRPRCG
jgi:hypothetical protein